MRQHSIYEVECPCGRQIETRETEFVCSCGRLIEIHWGAGYIPDEKPAGPKELVLEAVT